MFTTSPPLPHFQFVYSSDTSIFPAKRDKSVGFPPLAPDCFRSPPPPPSPAQITTAASSSHSSAPTPIQLPKTKTIFFFLLNGGGEMVCKTALAEYLVFMVSQTTFPGICEYSLFNHTLLIRPQCPSLLAGSSTKQRRTHSILDLFLKPGTPRSEQKRFCIRQGGLGWWEPQKAGEGGNSDLGS